MTQRSRAAALTVGAAAGLALLAAAPASADEAISPAPADPQGGVLVDEVPVPGTPDLSGLPDIPEFAPATVPTLPSGQDPDGDVPALTHEALPAPELGAPAEVGQEIARSSAQIAQAQAAVEDLFPTP
jgi:hypothetical protein